jgi:eukaryotic-like serine/threonine-protein kinase
MVALMLLGRGQKLAHYEIVEPIGKGGMGEVYLARDKKLERDVAIKVLPEEFSRDAERLARFKREAKVLASLNHPNIAAIHGIEESGPTHFLVLELVPGDTLQSRLSRGRLAVGEALTLATQVAAALAEAHDKGIVHRDLKPGNVMLTEDGQVKVLDFGLARAFAEDPPESDSSLSPTLTRDATQTGVILGTAAYMSPEQARGRELDKRSDVFSFGAVLFEMLSGTRAFHGEDVSDILASVIKLEPNWSALPDGLDPHIGEILRRCLEKDRKKRRRDVGDVGMEIEEALARPADRSAPVPRSSKPAVWGGAVGLLAGIAAAWILMPSSPAPPVTRFTIPSEGVSIRSRHALAVSPDGRILAFTRNGQLHLRNLDRLETTALPGTDGARSLAFSPDGQWIAFESLESGGLQKSPVSGGTPVSLTATTRQHGVSWVDDTIYFAEWVSGPGRIVRMSSNGGETEVLVEPKENERLYFPRLLPDGRTLLFTVARSGSSKFTVETQSLATKDRRVLVDGGSDAHYLASGHLVYRVGSTLQAARFDVDTLEVKGPAATVVEGVMPVVGGGDRGGAQYAVSDSGTLFYLAGEAQNQRLAWVDRKGKSEPLAFPLALYGGATLSPDERMLAVELDRDIWIYDIFRGSTRRLTFTEDNGFPLWTPDGQYVLFASNRRGVDQIFRRRSDGSGEAEPLTTGELRRHPDSVSPDGSSVVFHEHHPDHGTDIWTLDLDANHESRLFLRTPFDEQLGTVSPDGRWLAYVSNESGGNEVYVTPFPAGGSKTPISTGSSGDVIWSGVGSPVWSADGKDLFYRDGNRLMAVSVELGDTIRVGVPTFLFESPFTSPVTTNAFDVTADGERFLVMAANETAAVELHVVLNWYSELERILPAK